MKTHTSNIKVSTLLLAAALLVPSLALAQHDGYGQKYVFGSVGKGFDSAGTKIGAGIGFERLFGPGIGAGAEFQGFGIRSTWQYGGNTYHESYGGILFSANGSYHFRTGLSSGKAVPFVTAGYSGWVECGSGCGGISGFNYGGGATYWLKPNRGLRLEVRDHVFNEYSATHAVEFRVGFSF